MRKRRFPVPGILGAVAALILLLQIIPIYRLTNPPVVAEPAWDSPQTRALAKRACFDCHSNETVWPWYAHVAPVKWIVASDVKDGRRAFNLSDWHSGDMNGRKAAEEIAKGEMPLPQYMWMHSAARLNETEKQQLSDGLAASMK